MYADDIVKELYEYAVETGNNSDLEIELSDGYNVDFIFHSTNRGPVYIIPSEPLALLSEVDELKSTVEEKNDEISRLTAELESEREEVRMLEEENSSLSDELVTLRSQYE